MQERKLELRAFTYIDSMQPQYAAFVGTTVNGDIPIVGMAELFVEVGPGNEVFRVADLVLKSARVKPAVMLVEREFGLLEIHAEEQAAVKEGANAILAYLGLQVSDRVKPQIASTQMITNVDPYQAQLINNFRRGSMLVPGEALFILEIAPAGYIVLAANEAEKAANIKLIHVQNVGRFGRMYISGTESEARAGSDAAIAAIESVTGR